MSGGAGPKPLSQTRQRRSTSKPTSYLEGGGRSFASLAVVMREMKSPAVPSPAVSSARKSTAAGKSPAAPSSRVSVVASMRKAAPPKQQAPKQAMPQRGSKAAAAPGAAEAAGKKKAAASSSMSSPVAAATSRAPAASGAGGAPPESRSKKLPYSDAERIELRRLVQKHGTKWATILKEGDVVFHAKRSGPDLCNLWRNMTK